MPRRTREREEYLLGLAAVPAEVREEIRRRRKEQNRRVSEAKSRLYTSFQYLAVAAAAAGLMIYRNATFTSPKWAWIGMASLALVVALPVILYRAIKREERALEELEASLKQLIETARQGAADVGDVP